MVNVLLAHGRWDHLFFLRWFASGLGDCVGGELLTAEVAEEVAEEAERHKECSGIWKMFFATFADLALRSLRSRALMSAPDSRESCITKGFEAGYPGDAF